MPLYLPPNLPAVAYLEKEHISLESPPSPASPLRIAILNLMPLKIETEIDFVRLLSYTSLNVELRFMRLEGHTSKNTPAEHLLQFYQTFRTLKKERIDGLIITGAPVEHLPFEEVDYWEELCEVFRWAKEKVATTLYICWGAQAGLYYHHQIPKYPIDKKMFGVFPHNICTGYENIPIFRGFDSEFYVPHSRHTEVRATDIEKHSSLSILCTSPIAGVHIVMENEGQAFYITGHSEYAPLTLHKEYQRDIQKGLCIAPPEYYYPNDDCHSFPMVRWRSSAHLFFNNWLQYYVLPLCKEI